MNCPSPADPAADRLEERMAAQPWRTPPAELKTRILCAVSTPASAAARTTLRSWRWSELFWPGPWAWGAVVVLWVAVMAFGFGAERIARRGTSLAKRDIRSHAPAWMDWREQQALITALLEEEPATQRPPAALRPRSALPAPRLGGRRPSIPSRSHALILS